jgi:tetratricopeptide (TPR) repeat protein
MHRADTEAPPVLLPELRAFLELLLQLISRPQPGDVGDRLRATASSLALASARLFWVAGQPAETYVHYALAEVLAREAGATTQLAMMLVDKSETVAQFARREADLMRSLALADAAQHAVEGREQPGVLAWIHGERAVQYSMLGDGTAAGADIDRLVSLADQSGPEEFNLFSSLDSAWSEQYKGACALKLGRPDEAIVIYDAVLSRTDQSLIWERSRAIVQLADAWAEKAEVERACALLLDAVPVIRGSRNERDLHAVLRVRRRLNRWRSTPALRQLDEALKRG